MHKIITISALATILSLPAFAEITNNATCNTTNLGQSNNNSTANVEANWNANTININWYNGDTRVAQNTCTYDGSITLPTQPTKPGYTFSGWRLRATPVGPNCSAINNESTCNNTNGCAWNPENNKCHVAITAETSSYTKCSDITDRDTCLSIIYRDEQNYNPFLCYWDQENNNCNLGYGIYAWSKQMPESWCQDAIQEMGADYCSVYDNNTCHCDD